MCHTLLLSWSGMERFDHAIAFITSRQHGLVARWQARDEGVPDWALDDRVRRRQLVPVHPGVYRHRAVPFTRGLRWLAAVLAGGRGAVLSHRAAAALHNFDVRRVVPEVTVPYSRLPILDGVQLHRSRRLGPRDIVVVDRIPATSRPRTVLDLGAVLPIDSFEPIVQDAVARRLVRVESLIAVLDRRGGRGVEGTVSLRAALENGLVDEKVESKLELLIARIIERAAIPAPMRQYPLTCADGRVVRLDNAWPAIRVAVEGDGRRWHGSATQARQTRARSRSITQTGWDHYVYGWFEATETPLDVQKELERAILPVLLAA